jgi:quinol monooxygenase YgiN
MSQVVVVAVVKAKQGSEAEVEQAFRTAIRKSHEEEGNVRYALHRSTSDPATFVMIEQWASQAALDQHFGAPHMAELMTSMGSHVEGGPTVVFAEALPEGDPSKGAL